LTIPELQAAARRLVSNIESALFGKAEAIQTVLVALLCEGHILIEDVPGVGKTTLAHAIAQSLGCGFARIQCTPDLLPSDLIGVNIFNQKSGEFQFRPGPIHHNIVLVDEINRATPKTQSALLECMEERQATVDGVTYRMPRPFLVLATQNPVEFEGTYPLPEAQLDRFFLRVRLGYPEFETECQMLSKPAASAPLASVVSGEELGLMQAAAAQVTIEDNLRGYLVNLVRRSRQDSRLQLGASPRGSLALFRAAQVTAALDGRSYILPDDIQKMSIATLSHRFLGLGMDSASAEAVVREFLESTPVPIKA
jgi:MoxR-like ATPase